MPHDMNNTPIKEGDLVFVPMHVKRVYQDADENFCNCDLETVFPMPGNGTNSTLSAISTKQVILQLVKEHR